MDPWMITQQPSIGGVVQHPLVVDFIQQFKAAVRGAHNEHAWTLLADGEVLRRRGDREGVAVPEVPEDTLAVVDIHNHPNATGRRNSMLHLSDLGACFNSGRRLFSTALVLVQTNEGIDYVTGARFSRETINSFMHGDRAALEVFTATLAKIHRDERAGHTFARRVSETRSIQEMQRLYEETLPMMEFIVVLPE